jgi:predicted nucleic acid-binding protein
MKYVLDSCVAIKWVLFEEFSPTAIRLRTDYRSEIHELIAPDVLPLEVGHALMKAERQGKLSASQGSALWTDVMLDVPRLFPSLELMPRALTLSSECRIGVYDCLYAALAEREDCELLSADERLMRAIGTRASLIHLRDLPAPEAPST